MICVPSEFPGGVVGVIQNDLSRYPHFWFSMMRLFVPPNSGWIPFIGNGFATPRNEIIRQCYKDEKFRDFQWIWFIDDDNPHSQDVVMHLLSRNVDIIQPIVSTRKPPYRPYGYRFDQTTGEYFSLTWDEIPTQGIYECDGLGAGGMLIRREVLDAMGDPWFEEGKTYADAIGEDLYFCTKAKKLGFKCFLDCEATIGHMTTACVLPKVGPDGKWVIDLDLYHAVHARLPTDFGEGIAR